MEMRMETTPDVGIRWHPYAELFPWIEGAAFDEFVEDIRQRGVLEPIVMFEGQLLDGRNRYMAARKLGIKYPVTEYRGKDPLGYVLSKNLARRHLNESQRAMVAAKLAKLDHGVRQTGKFSDVPTQSQAAEKLNVSDRTLRSARIVQEEGTPELVEAVEHGEVAVSTAADIAKLPPDEQRRLIESADPKVLRAVIKEKRQEAQNEKKERRVERERELAGNIAALPEKRYGVILADPEWRFEVFSDETGQDRAAANHYPTSATDEIAARPIQNIAANDCVLFLWATAPMLPDALRVMQAWGFTYKSHAVWDKQKDGTGYWFRNRHELLLVGTRGDVPAPAMGTQISSIQQSPAYAHSQKPEWALLLIEQLFPNLPKIELNRRGPAREGWDAWGNEVTEEAAE